MKKNKSSIGQWLVSGVVVIVAIAIGIFIWHKATQSGAETPVTASSTASTAAGPAHASTAVQHPIGQATPAPASTTPLPPLDQSDADVANALLTLAGGNALDGLLHRNQIVRRVVATVDALPRQSVGANILPLETPKGAFLVEQADGTMTLSPRNAERYAPYMQVLRNVDPKALVAWYVAHYPLFQQAYRDLGYPKGYFNDRLVVAIDDMLAAPVPDAPVKLVQPKVFYRYDDPGLEARSAGQKLLMRLGSDDEAKVKAKLRQIRDLLTGATLPAEAGSVR